jgi:hypothetical protein
MSEEWGKVAPLMETQNENGKSESSASSTVSRYNELVQLVANMKADFEKFYNDGNKAAGTRVRGAMQELKSFAQTVRNEVTELKNKEGGEPAAKE